MKKILFVLLAVAVFSNVQAQYDTIWKCPYLYHYNWPETGIYYDDSVYCTFCFVNRGFGLGISGPNPYYDSALFYSFLDTNHADGYALYQHTDDSLEIIGLAAGYAMGGPCGPLGDTMRMLRTTLYDSSMNALEAVHGIYGPSPTSYSWRTDPTAHIFCYPGDIGGSLESSRVVYFRFFDKPVTVIGDYYLGLSYDYRSNYGMDIVFLKEKHSGPRHFPYNGHKIKAMDGRWSDVLWDTLGIPLLWAIVRTPCEVVDSVTLVADTNGCMSVDWVRPRYQSAWEVRLETPNGREVTQVVDTNHWEYCGLSSNQSYTFYLRSLCDDANGDYSWSDWGNALIVVRPASHGITSVDGMLVDLMLRPNPATDEVTVDAKSVVDLVSISVTDMAGVEILRREGVRLPLTVGTASLAAGTYMVRVVTPQGTAVQKLMVMHK